MRCTIIPGDIGQKMGDSIFIYKGLPYYVKHHDEQNISLHKVTDINGEIKIIKYNDPDLDFSSIPLGYVNNKAMTTVAYLTRTPVRKVKQGLNGHNTRAQALPDHPGLRNSISNYLYSQSFIDMVTDKYPSLEDTFKKLRASESPSQIAISKMIALSIDGQGIIKVYYKNQYVGWIEPNKYIVHVTPVKSAELGWVISKYLSHVLGWMID